MDTAKAANLFTNYPECDVYEFINAPIGRGRPIEKKLSPLIASTSLTLSLANPCSSDDRCSFLPITRVSSTDMLIIRVLVPRQLGPRFLTFPQGNSKRVLHPEH